MVQAVGHFLIMQSSVGIMRSNSRLRYLFLLVSVLAGVAAPGALAAQTLERTTQATLTAVEMNDGEVLRFRLANGETRTLEVVSTAARVLLTNLPQFKKGFHGGQSLYEMICRVRVDGHPLTMRRYVPVQQSLYEPYVINGLRIWFDGVRDIEQFLNDNHGGGLPRKDARFALQDMTLPICPEPLRPWYPNRENYIDVGESYNANDVWMGPYQGADLHGGLDVNMPIGTPLWAPIDFDTQFYFNSLAAGDNNNRWRGIRTWPNGERWVLQAHHIVRLLVPEHQPLKQNKRYAEAAGILTGSHAHSHFVFKIGPEDDEVLLDAWILFWQIFENNKRRAGAIRAAMDPLSPAKCGTPVKFDAAASQPGPTGNGLRYRWTFGDGGTALGPNPQYVFLRPGIYPVTLTVDDGAEKASFTQHLTVDGELAELPPSLVLASPEAFTFWPRPVEALDVYGWPVRHEPMTLQFTARPRTSPRPAPQQVLLQNNFENTSESKRSANCQVEVRHREGRDWLHVTKQADNRLAVAVDAAKLSIRYGIYHADVYVDCPGAVNSPQVFSVRLEVPPPQAPPQSTVIVDNTDPGCQATPWFWLSPQFFRHFPDRWPPGYRGSYLFASSLEADQPDVQERRVRFTPDLRSGAYKVRLADEASIWPLPESSVAPQFRVRVHHADGDELLWIEPRKSRELGTFQFDEGTDGFVELLWSGSSGGVVADAVHFERQ